MINDLARQIPEFPEVLKNELIHCILSHHGELEYGSPKKPALVEAVASILQIIQMQEWKPSQRFL